MKLAVNLSAIVFVAMLASCGGGGGGTTAATTTTPTTYSGVFIDAPTKGLGYIASPSGLTGTTDSTGKFTFQAGDTVTFSLPVGGGNLSVGSWQPTTPSAGSNAVVFVQSLANGLQVAQVLQSLNHGSATAMDVSGLTLSSSAVTNINNFVASGGTALPTGVTTDVALLASAQLSNSGQIFVAPGGATVTATLGSLQTSLTNLSPATGVTVSTTLPGKVVFHQGSVTGGSGGTGTRSDFGLTYFKTDNTIVSISASNGGGNQSIQTGATYSTASNVLTILGGGFTDTITLSYIDTLQGLWIDHATDGSTGAGSYAFVQSALTTSTIAGKTLTFVGSLGGCGSVPFQLVIDSAGANFTANCKGSAVGTNGIGTVANVPSMPGVLLFTSTNGTDLHYVGLVSGTAANGAVGVVQANNATNYSNGIFGFTAQ